VTTDSHPPARERVQLYLAENPEALGQCSLRELGEQIGISHEQVRRSLAQLGISNPRPQGGSYVRHNPLPCPRCGRTQRNATEALRCWVRDEPRILRALTTREIGERLRISPARVCVILQALRLHKSDPRPMHTV
jgi:hypothetical protein